MPPLHDFSASATEPFRLNRSHQRVRHCRRTNRSRSQGQAKRFLGDFYLHDRACPLAYEPSGEDFLSPCVAEADLMRRVLTAPEFTRWLRAFLPSLPADGRREWLAPGVVTDPTDPKLGHLYGLNLSRAWMLQGIARSLPASDRRSAALIAAARIHSTAGMTGVTEAHYEGGHWLGTFAVYLETGRGLPPAEGKR